MARFTHPAFGDTDGLTTEIKSYTPVWSGTGLAFTGTPATGYYIKIGNLIQLQIDVAFANVSNFGTGQYSVHDVGNGGVVDHYSLKGHLSPSSTSMTIWDLKASGLDEQFDHNSPFVLTTADKFHMSFSYICE